MTSLLPPHPRRPRAGASRRSFLRGLGAAVSLPFMHSLAPRRAFAQSNLNDNVSGSPPQRFIGFFVPNGMNVRSFWPVATGPGVTESVILESLRPVADSVLLLGNVHNTAAESRGTEGGGDHARGTGTFLTSTYPERAYIRNGVSVDQLVADTYSTDRRLRSLELGMERGRAAGECDTGYSCAYTQNISWGSPTTPNPKEVNPRVVFDRLFAGTTVTESREQVARRRAEDLSILDFVRDDTRRVKQRLAVNDRARLDEYLTGLRELERRINTIDLDAVCPAPERPEGSPVDATAYGKSLLDLMVIAFQCDMTTAATMMVGNSVSERSLPELGIAQSHHELSHHQNRPEKLEALNVVNRWEVELFAHTLIRLSEIEEPGPNGDMQSILYNTTAVFGSELSDGNQHNHDDMPMIIAGRAGGQIKGGEYIRTAGVTKLSDVHFTLLTAMGVPVERFGDDGDSLVSEILA